MSKFTDRIKNVFTVDYDDYDEDLNVFQQEELLQEMMTTL